MSNIFYPNACKSNRYQHHILSMSAYLFWCFRCLTGWTHLDRVDDFYRLPFRTFLDKIKLTDYPSEHRRSDEQFRFGILDYLFVIPGLIKLLLHTVKRLGSSTYGEDTLTVRLLFGGSEVAMIPFIILNYTVAFVFMMASSPILICYRLYQTYQWDKNMDAIKALEVYSVPPHHFEAEPYLLKLYNDFSEIVEKRTVNELISEHHFRYSNVRFTHSYTENNQLILTLTIWDFIRWRPLGIVFPHQGNKVSVKAIQYLGLYDFFTPFNKVFLNQLNQQCNQKEPRQLAREKQRFEMFFSISQALKLATQDASNGVQHWVNSDIPDCLFNAEIAGFAGMIPLDKEASKAHNQLHHRFLKQGRLFQESPLVLLSSQYPFNPTYDYPYN